MSNGSRKRTRLERVAALELPPGVLERTWIYLQRGDVLARLGLCLLAIVALWFVTKSWSIPLGVHRNYTPARDIVAKTPFEQADPEQTREARIQAARKVRYVYDQDKDPLVQLRAALQNRVVIVAGAKSLAELDKKVWSEFFPPPVATPGTVTQVVPSAEEQEQTFLRFHDAVATPESLAKLERAIGEALAPYEDHGLMEKLPQEHNEGNQQEIVVQAKGQPERSQIVKVSDVLIGEADGLKKALAERLESPEVARATFTWLRSRLPTTLTLDRTATQAAKDRAVASVSDVFIKILPGEPLARGGQPLSDASINLLQLEHQAFLKNLGFTPRAAYSLAVLGMFIALSVLCGVYVVHYGPRMFQTLRRFATTLALVVIAVGLAVLTSGDNVRAEVVPLIMFGMIMSIAYHRELALLFAAAVTLVVVVCTAQGMSEFMILNASVASAILLVGGIRNRRKLIYVGIAVGFVAMLTTLGVETLDEQPISTIGPDAMRFGLSAVFAGLLMLGLLPFIESLFGVQTELSLLELGDVAHPLLQELVRRAPGTYNHSINVASIAEAAAESIGAKGLLVRVGAYFHDIGKMLKPGYFVENMGHDANRHESLMPAMSTLIIIAHIKDGADLARQHRLPEPIIDFIEQHHGTTLVEYFYRRANQRNESNPDAPEIDESDFRYPGPKPQTKEAAVLMLADAVESASRALVEPTPARIESLVQEISMKRLLDGQFDSCGLTLSEVATINDSLVKSVTAVYHGRIKYPDQRTA
ncbi:MAG TPA: HDIG domain-containing protein [Pirellulales bacterium]|nr:HDIG domain-containing protein [Pirellulales bacterium]